MKFADMTYVRVTPEETGPRMDALTRRIREAVSGEEALAAFYECQTLSDHVQTMMALAQVRFTINTEDELYARENDYYDEVSPRFTEQSQALYRALVDSPHRAALVKELGQLLFTNVEIDLKTFKPEILPDLQEENRLTTAYVKLLASAKLEFDGQVLNLSQMTPYGQSPDRQVRKSACETKAKFFEDNAGELDHLFDELVKVRTKMARALGFPSFVELGYCRMGRNCYTKDDVAAFRSHVKQHIVPLADRLKALQAARIGLEHLTVYDDPLSFPDGNACPTGTPEDIFAHGKRMYHELSPVTAEFIDFMLQNDLFDVLSKHGKSGGGYCTFFPEYKAPFIFANFNGTAHDIDVLTHEAGHALAAYMARDMRISDLRSPTMESCEIHSMSMEFFTWPWMEGFFGEQTAKYRYGHLAGALEFLPYGTIVDAFQHLVYEQPDMTPAERNEAWLKLEADFRPYLDMAGIPFYSGGARWQAQSHIYEAPFYYIDYCLAQTVALTFWSEMQHDRTAAWDRYVKLVSQAGTRTFNDLVTTSGLPLPFDGAALKNVAQSAMDYLETHKL